LITVTLDTSSSQSKDHDEKVSNNSTVKGIYFPSGNIATPISHPLHKEKEEKKNEPKPQGLDQLKEEHDKIDDKLKSSN
jgi:hypothetical protein